MFNKSDKNQSGEMVSCRESMDVLTKGCIYVRKENKIRMKLHSSIFQWSYFKLFASFTELLLHFYIKKEQVPVKIMKKSEKNI